MGTNYHQILRESIAGERSVDEQSFASFEILSERLERLKKTDKIFEKISFSPAVEAFGNRKNAVTV